MFLNTGNNWIRLNIRIDVFSLRKVIKCVRRDDFEEMHEGDDFGFSQI